GLAAEKSRVGCVESGGRAVASSPRWPRDRKRCPTRVSTTKCDRRLEPGELASRAVAEGTGAKASVGLRSPAPVFAVRDLEAALAFYARPRVRRPAARRGLRLRGARGAAHPSPREPEVEPFRQLRRGLRR